VRRLFFLEKKIFFLSFIIDHFSPLLFQLKKSKIQKNKQQVRRPHDRTLP